MADPTYDYLDYDGLALYDEKIKALIAAKQDKESGKGLSTNDYTTTEKEKLAGIASGATKNSATTTTPKMDGTAAVGTETTYAKGDHVHPTDTSRAPVSHASTATTYGIGTSGNYGHVKLSDSTSSTSAASSGIAASPKAVKDALDAAKSYADAKADSDTTYTLEQDATDGHKITFTPSEGESTTITIPDNDTTYPNATDTTGGVMTDTQAKKLAGIASGATKNAATTTTPKMDGTAAVGSETTYAKGDHVHPTDTSRAPLANPEFTGTPKAPTASAGTKTTQIATTAFVDTAITNAIAGIQGISYEVVASLPATGSAGVIYLVANSGSAPNIYDEYIWTGSAFEKIGTTDVDLSGYQPKMDAITNAQINALFA